jgi:hypothetical protein
MRYSSRFAKGRRVDRYRSRNVGWSSRQRQPGRNSTLFSGGWQASVGQWMSARHGALSEVQSDCISFVHIFRAGDPMTLRH